MVRIIPNRLKPSGNSAATSAANSRSTSPIRGKADTSNPDARKDSGLHLVVAIIRARNLAAKDRGGTSDPYLVLTLGDAKHVTHSVPKTLNPEWNEVCYLPISDIASLLLGVCCWDKDRFGKDYLGEFDLALEEIFTNDKIEQEPRWFGLRSKRPGKKTSVVSGEVLLQFMLVDLSDKTASSECVMEKFNALVKATPEAKTPTSSSYVLPTLPLTRKLGEADDYDDDDAYDDEALPEDDDLSKPEAIEKRRRRLRIKGLKKKRRDNHYEFIHSSGGDVLGIIFLEIKNITDLPPESNFTKTSFDMDPFVVASLGRKTFRTKMISHNLNPVFNEKMIFQVQSNEQSYSFAFTVIDHDKYSGNDFIASASLPVREFIDRGPKADPESGLYDLPSPPEYVPQAQRVRFKRLGLSRSSSSQSLTKMPRSVTSSKPAFPASIAGSSTIPDHQMPERAGLPNALQSQNSNSATIESPSTNSILPASLTSQPIGLLPVESAGCNILPSSGSLGITSTMNDLNLDTEDQEFTTFNLPLKMKNLDKWEDKHNPQLCVRAKYMPYPALRQQFWRAMLKQYDTDESGRISKVELSTMLDTLGSTLKESTIEGFFQRFTSQASTESGCSPDDEMSDLTIDQVVICLEDQLEAKSKLQGPLPSASMTNHVKGLLPNSDTPASGHLNAIQPDQVGPSSEHKYPFSALQTSTKASRTMLPTGSGEVSLAHATTSDLSDLTPFGGEDGEILDRDYLNDRDEEHVVKIRDCPICHQPRLNKRRDADIITHIATCASQDWRQVNNLVMGGFVTASQAQRKWYSKVITKISYGGYRIGANSANILVQDRITGQINEEKMSVYVRLGIRLLYKGLRSSDMENKRIRKMLKGLSIKQGKKYDDPASKQGIQKFIDFHQLDMSEVLLPVDEFRNFNEFFYRALKPGARPCSAQNNPHIVVSPADCRSVVFNHVESATKIWIKGREFSVRRLLGDISTREASRFASGALGIFRLAPQDYHRFHIPVDGILGRPRLIAGEYYTVNPMAIRSALDVYGENVRVVVPIESDVHGKVMVVCVGAMMVGSTVITRKEGERVKRAEELGYFKFGGSTIVLLFEDGRVIFDDDLVENSSGALETLIRAGMSVGHSPSELQWKADMPKDQREITEEDKLEAKRRIQGSSSAEDNSPEDSGGDETPM